MKLTASKKEKCSHEFLVKHFYHLDCSMGNALLEGIETLRKVLKYNSYDELAAIAQVAITDEEDAPAETKVPFSPEELLYLAWAGCEEALEDIKKNLTTLDGDTLFITAISLAHLNQDKGFELLTAIACNKAPIILDEDDIYFLFQEYIHYVQHPKAREIEETYLANHPNNLFLQ
ncbi:hypothetical protein NBRC116592_03880 [Colwellia sp. KU-HH00111]|uniref:hypothetical protein n=1 Tax=Colwellia sp. KU-HH00111 TaxID=3127652 RepID=UPI003104D0A3